MIYQTKSASRSDQRWMILNKFWVQSTPLQAVVWYTTKEKARRVDRRWMILNKFCVSHYDRRWMIYNTFWVYNKFWVQSALDDT
jgi:hypothetical protein